MNKFQSCLRYKWCLKLFYFSIVMGSGQTFLTRVGLIFCGSGRVSHLWFGLKFRKFPLKMSNFSIFSLRVGSKSTRVKSGSAFYLMRVKSKLGSGQGPSLLLFDPELPNPINQSSHFFHSGFHKYRITNLFRNKLAINDNIKIKSIWKVGCYHGKVQGPGRSGKSNQPG